MTDDMIKLGQRAVACKGWRWMPGMLAVEVAGPGMSLTGGRPVRVDDCWHAVNVWRPDLSDPATLGCLLALVRKAWGCSGMSTIQNRGCWEVWKCQKCSGECFAGFGATEAEALVDALEGAP